MQINYQTNFGRENSNGTYGGSDVIMVDRVMQDQSLEGRENKGPKVDHLQIVAMRPVRFIDLGQRLF